MEIEVLLTLDGGIRRPIVRMLRDDSGVSLEIPDCGTRQSALLLVLEVGRRGCELKWVGGHEGTLASRSEDVATDEERF